MQITIETAIDIVNRMRVEQPQWAAERAYNEAIDDAMDALRQYEADLRVKATFSAPPTTTPEAR